MSLVATICYRGGEPTVTYEDVILCRPNNGVLEINYRIDDNKVEGKLIPFDRIFDVIVTEIDDG